MARVRFGERLTPEQLTQLEKDFASYLRSSERLRATKLQNGDEPDFMFSAG